MAFAQYVVNALLGGHGREDCPAEQCYDSSSTSHVPVPLTP